MPHRHVVAIDRGRGAVAGLLRCQMSDDLVPVQTEVDPVVRRTPLKTTEQAAVERARVAERGDRKGEVERVQSGHCGSRMPCWSAVKWLAEREGNEDDPRSYRPPIDPSAMLCPVHVARYCFQT